MFFASVTIAENYSDQTFVAPEFFLISIIWIIEALIGVIIYLKFYPKYFLSFSILIIWGPLPLVSILWWGPLT